MKQRAEITFEVEEMIVLREGSRVITAFCPGCGENGDMVSPDVLSLVAGVTEREIFRLVELDEIYFIESHRLVVCLGCYRKSMAKNELAVGVLKAKE